MSKKKLNNAIVAQSGGPTSVINASLLGVIEEVQKSKYIDNIYGSLNGITGILNEKIINLSQNFINNIENLRYTPGAALGTSRYKISKEQDLEKILKIFKKHNIRYFFFIGGNDSQDTTLKICEFASLNNYLLHGIGIPKTIDNDLFGTDHCPGYGSALKYLSTTIKEVSFDVASMSQGNLVMIIEVMGRDAGWLAAGTTLIKNSINDVSCPPHLIYLPENTFYEEQFLHDVQNVIKINKYCIAVVSEGVKNDKNNYLSHNPYIKDSFGHTVLGGVGNYLANLVETKLKYKARSSKLSIHQRSAAHCSSLMDNNEAFLCGQKAVKITLEGATKRMIIINRLNQKFTLESIDLKKVPNKVKQVPLEWINDQKNGLNNNIIEYAYPLIQGEIPLIFKNGVPDFIKLKYNFIK